MSKLNKFPFQKNYKWTAQVNVDLPAQLGSEKRIFQLNGEKTIEFGEHKDASKASIKLVNQIINLDDIVIYLTKPSIFLAMPVKIPHLSLNSELIDFKSVSGEVELKTGLFVLQFIMNIPSKLIPLLKAEGIDQLPILIQEAGKLDLDEGSSYSSLLRFSVGSKYQKQFQIHCGGGKTSCATDVNLVAAVGDSQSKEGGQTLWICPGDKVALWWYASSDVTSLRIDADVGSSIGAVPLSGYKVVNPTQTTKYTIVAIGDCERKASVTVNVVTDGTRLDMCASPIQQGKNVTVYWEYIMSSNCVSKSIVVTSIKPSCAPSCFYYPMFDWTYLDCPGCVSCEGTNLCHGNWAMLKTDSDGHLRSATINLFRIDLPNIPLAGTWNFFSLGIEVLTTSGTANFTLTLKCNK